MFGEVFRGRRVLISGDTGFKGGWLAHWLVALGAEVSGCGLPADTQPNLFAALKLGERIDHTNVDICDAAKINDLVERLKPELVLHLAAQPLVRASYVNPKTTFDTNVGGLVNMLEAIRSGDSVRACVVVTSDKCYENREWLWGYRENEPMGGHDPYSASKGAAELVVSSYRRSFFLDSDIRIATARAGNVIGGGDWSNDRIITDFVTSIVNGEPLRLRYPRAVRPWQHVCEPLAGYLQLAALLMGPDGQQYAEAWNFGPKNGAYVTVQQLAESLVNEWGRGEIVVTDNQQHHEANLLQLDCTKAAARLGWQGVWDVPDAISKTVDWYRAYYDGVDAAALTEQQLNEYALDSKRSGLPWATSSRSKLAA